MTASEENSQFADGLTVLASLREVHNQSAPKWVVVDEEDVPHYKSKGCKIEEAVSKSQAIGLLEKDHSAGAMRENALVAKVEVATALLAKQIAGRDGSCDWANLDVSGREKYLSMARQEIEQDLVRASIGLRGGAISSDERKAGIYRHKKRGTLYRIIAFGRLQINNQDDMAECVSYEDIENGTVWTRLSSEFFDGRFVLVDVN